MKWSYLDCPEMVLKDQITGFAVNNVKGFVLFNKLTFCHVMAE